MNLFDQAQVVKGLPVLAEKPTNDAANFGEWNVARGDLPSPVLTISRSAVENNLDVMARWCSEHDCLLAPHGKTSMAPELFRRQLEAGAWGISVATVRQAVVALAAGASRIIVANEVVDTSELDTLCELSADPARSILVFVDSPSSVDLLAVAGKRNGCVLQALVEVGVFGGRTGVRGEAAFLDLLRSVASSDHVRLLGVSAFESVLSTERDSTKEGTPISQASALRTFIEEIAGYIVRARSEGLLSADSIVTAGGSLAFDLVVEILGPLTETFILRSGCYVTHDHGLYASLSPFRATPTSSDAKETLLPALNLWARISSIPETNLAIAGFGRRDANEDANFPVPLCRVSTSGERETVVGWAIDQMWDQHARLRSESAASTHLNVGDLLTFGISHPCTVFDKWKTIVEIDEFDNVIGLMDTYF
jgi:D-serine dehydratase